MFGGIIEAVGQVQSSRDAPAGKTLVVSAPGYWAGTPRGASIAVDGVCLTVTEVAGDNAAFDVIAETLRRSTLGELRPGDPVNLQKSLVVGERIDGHFVQGHADALGTIVRVERAAGEAIWWFATDAEAMACIVPKGSIAIDGISLTIVAVQDDQFSVALIPTTLSLTTLGRKRPGDRVNIETDVLARTIVHYLRAIRGSPGRTPGGLTLEQLARNGFI